MNNFLIFLGGLLLGAIITEVVHLYFSSIIKWLNSSIKEQCAYDTKEISHPPIHDIIITQKYGKITYINCYWFKRRETKIVDGVTYKHCIYGEKFLTPNGKGASQCPFDKQYLK